MNLSPDIQPAPVEARGRISYYAMTFGFLLLLTIGLLALTGCIPKPSEIVASCAASALPNQLMENQLPAPTINKLTAQGQFAEVWVEIGTTGVFTPAQSAQGASPQSTEDEIPDYLDELAAKGFVAIRVPHAPPAYTPSQLLPGIPPNNLDPVIVSYFIPTDSETLTTESVNIIRRTDYEPLVNARYPITDGRSHWEVWWLPEGATFPIPDQPFRVDAESWPPPLGLRFRVDFGDADAIACAGCPVEIALFNGYVFIPSYKTTMRYTNSTAIHEPPVVFGTHCAFEAPDLFTSVVQSITPGEPFTHTFCLENWDTVAHTLTISATSSQDLTYAYYSQEVDAEAQPVEIDQMPFTVDVGPPTSSWEPGLLGLVVVHTPADDIDPAILETLHITATSKISQEVQANAVSYALGPEYEPEAEAPTHTPTPTTTATPTPSATATPTDTPTTTPKLFLYMPLVL